MKIFDAVKIATKSAKGKWVIISALFIAVCSFCLCFAGAIFVSVQQEKDLPYELSVSTTKKITDAVLQQIGQIEGVAAVSPVVQVPVTLKAGNCIAQLTVTGLNRDYINRKFETGGVFPNSSTMPYIILNKAVCKLFSDGRNSFGGEKKEADINWLYTSFVLETETGKSETARVCGILPDETDTDTDEPLTWMDLKKVQDLLEASEQPMDPMQANVRVNNSGYAEKVTAAITGFGLTVTNPNEKQQTKWDNSLKEADYLIALAAFSLVFTLLFIQMEKKLTLLEQNEMLSMLSGMGMNKQDIRRLFVLRTMLVVLYGIAAGIIVALFTPMFILPEDAATSNFTLYTPWWIAAITACICLGSSTLSVLKRNG